MSKTTYAKDFHKAFLVDDKFLRRAGDLIVGHQGNITCKVWLSDSATITGLSLDELVSLANTSSRRITRIDIVTSYDDPLRAELSLRDDNIYSDPISYEVVGNDKDATYVSSELEKLLTGIFQWYSPLAVIRAFHFVVGVGLFTLGVYVLVIAAVVKHSVIWSSLGLLLCVLPVSYHSLIRWAMPRGIFAIGDGVARAEQLKTRRWQVVSILVIVIGLGIAVNLVASVVFEKFFKS